MGRDGNGRRRLQLRRERLRQLTQLAADDLGRVTGGGDGDVWVAGPGFGRHGRAQSKGCP